MSFMVDNIFQTSEKIRKTDLKVTQNVKSFVQKCGVKAGEDIPYGSVSQTFSIQDLARFRIGEGEVSLGHRGLLEMREHSNEQRSATWGCTPSLSPDIHSCNIHLDIRPNEETNRIIPDQFVMKTIKNIPRGCELFLWFSEELLAMLNMPFLTPKNITGHRRYSCHLCNKIFETPNPLKIHLLLSCERESLNQVWQKIAKTLITQRYPVFNSKTEHKEIQLSIDRPSSVCTAPDSPNVDLNTRCISEPPLSAFLPYKKQSILPENLRTRNDLTQPLNLTMSHHAFPHNTGHDLTQNTLNSFLELRLTKSLEEISSNYAADVELFASNWGKMKQGHLCVYCGKIYSRKYGLKIHIRTHTGYKPLKCKYCQRPFGDPSNLNKHVRLHASGMTPYMCSLCGKVLVRRRDLERHIKSQHSNEENCSSDDNVGMDE